MKLGIFFFFPPELQQIRYTGLQNYKYAYSQNFLSTPEQRRSCKISMSSFEIGARMALIGFVIKLCNLEMKVYFKIDS